MQVDNIRSNLVLNLLINLKLIDYFYSLISNNNIIVNFSN